MTSFNWAEYLDLARELAGTRAGVPSDEAKFRSSMSRSYYSAFCSARNHLRDIDGDAAIPNSGRVHEYVRGAYQRSGNLRRQQVASWLDRLWAHRIAADYKDLAGVSLSSTAILDLDWSERILRNLATNPPRD